MNEIKVATAQFENSSGNKDHNLEIIAGLAARAAEAGADVIAFHECSITGYSHARHMSREELWKFSEPIPDGPSVQRLREIASASDIIVLTGLFEQGVDGNIYKAYVCVDKNGLIAKYRKIHPFINPHIKPGNEYVVFDILGWKCGILICYDNNIIENVRATALLGADIIFMPHVTMCTPSTRPGAGFVDPELWQRRESDPTSLRIEFDGLKGRAWLMKWLPARAYDNAVYAVFSNAIGMDDDQLKNGCSMILDPYGDVIAECRTLGDDFVIATLTPDKLERAGGHRYRMARKPELYKDIIGQPNVSTQQVVWMKKDAAAEA